MPWIVPYLEKSSWTMFSSAEKEMLPMNRVSLAGLVWSPNDLARLSARSRGFALPLARAFAKSRFNLRPSSSASFLAA